jgi:hypothetical protein
VAAKHGSVKGNLLDRRRHDPMESPEVTRSLVDRFGNSMEGYRRRKWFPLDLDADADIGTNVDIQICSHIIWRSRKPHDGFHGSGDGTKLTRLRQ